MLMLPYEVIGEKKLKYWCCSEIPKVIIAHELLLTLENNKIFLFSRD